MNSKKNLIKEENYSYSPFISPCNLFIDLDSYEDIFIKDKGITYKLDKKKFIEYFCVLVEINNK